MFCDQIFHCLRAKIEEYKTLKVHLDRGIDFQILGMDLHIRNKYQRDEHLIYL